MTENVVVRRKIKNVASGFNVGSDFVEALNEKVRNLIADACKRAESNGKRILRAHNL